MKEPNDIARKFKGVWISKALWLDRSITWLQKCVLAEIDNLSDEVDPCTASDAYLAIMFDVSTGRMSNIICELRASGHLISEMKGKKRFLRLNSDLTVSVKSGLSETVNPDLTVSVKSKPASNKGLDTRKEEPSPADAERKKFHADLIKLWTEEHVAVFGREYAFAGGKDAAAVKRILEATKKTPTEVMQIVRVAWKFPKQFNCKQAVSIAGLAGRWNEIVAEIAHLLPKTGEEQKPKSGPEDL